MPKAELADFMAGVPQPLAIGTMTLDDGRRVKGFLAEDTATLGAQDITAMGGWRAYLEAQKAATGSASAV